MVIRPYRVRYLNDPDGESYTQHVVYCEHWERAIWLALYLRAKIGKRREIERLIQSGKAWSERVELWCFRPRVNFRGGGEGGALPRSEREGCTAHR